MSALPLADEAEVVVVGAGPAGSVAAATLAELGRDVLVVDQSAFPRDKPCGDGLTHSAVELLEELGLRSLAEGGQRVEDCRIVVAHGNEIKGWYRPPARLPRSRYMRTVPRRSLDSALLEAAIERGARFRQARVDTPRLENGEARGVVLSKPEGGMAIASRCVIAADGATSRMRRVAKIGGETAGTPVYALRQYFTTEHRLDPVFDVYVPLLYDGGLLAGYGWVFPIEERRANVGVAYYSPPAGRPRTRIREVLSGFVRELEQREGERFGQLSDPSDPIGAPIAVQFSPHRCQLGDLLFAGEAARTADPLTGEGISFSMRSGRSAALVADGRLRSGSAPDLGRTLARQFPRLGQNLSLPARIAAGAAQGFRLAERDHQRFVLAVRRVTGSVPDEPGLEATPVRELLERDRSCAEALDAVNERLLDALRTEFPFGLEVLHREVRAAAGPLGAACALVVAGSCGGEPADALAAAEAAELVRLLDHCYPRLSPRARSDIAWINNAMAILLGDLALTRALRAPAEPRARCAGEIGSALQRIAEGQAIDAEDLYDPERSAERCLASLDARAGSSLALAAGLGALAVGAGEHASRMAEYGRELGIADQISEEIRELTVGDELTRRRPGSGLREGCYTLPVAYAIEADGELRRLLGDSMPGFGADSVRARIRDSGALQRAAGECRRHAELALDAVAAVPGDRVLLAALAELPLERLAEALGAGEAAHAADRASLRRSAAGV